MDGIDSWTDLIYTVPVLYEASKEWRHTNIAIIDQIKLCEN